MTPSDLKAIADQMCREAGWAPIPVDFKPVRKGKARRCTRRITMPMWPLEQGDAYAKAYMIHEVCHFLSGCMGHGYGFKLVEKNWLRQFGMISVYGRAYVKQLLDLQGNVLWTKTWKNTRGVKVTGDQMRQQFEQWKAQHPEQAAELERKKHEQLRLRQEKQAQAAKAAGPVA